jgi:tetratricopeptide (TPR) repeat protein
MSKDDLLFSIIGLLLGFILGFFLTNSYNQKAAAPAPQAAQTAADAPANEPAPPAVDPQELEAAKKQAADAPQDFAAQMNAGEAFYRARKYPEAAEFLNQANKLRPDAVETMIALGNTYFDDAANSEANDKWPVAEKWYTEALKKDAKNVNVRTDLGLTYLFRDPPDLDRAIQSFRKSLEIDPKHEQTLQNLTFALIKNNDKKGAGEALAQLEKTNPKNEALTKLRADLNGLK